MSSSENSDSDIEFVEEILRAMPRERFIRDRRNPFDLFDDLEFKLRYRFDKQTVNEFIDLIGPQLERTTRRNKALSVANQILIALRFYASGTFQQILGDHLNISQASVSRVIKQVTDAIARMRPQYIYMPQIRDDIRKVQNNFYQQWHFPCVIGAVDCTHIKMQSVGEHAELYRNRKGWFSYNVQCICDANLKFMHIIARWPGSVHDSTIFYDSALRVELENGHFQDSYLLGDGGYACKPYLLTPLQNPNNEAENRYNQAHIQTRNCIERAFGVWKRRFPCLSVGMRLKKETILSVIVATAILHNIAIDLKDNLPDADPNIVIPQEAYEMVPIDNVQHNDHTRVRQAVINNVFSL